MDEQQKRRLASFVVARENLRHGTQVGLRCVLVDYHLMPNGNFIVEVKWQVWGTPSIQPPLCLTLSADEVERLRHVWSGQPPDLRAGGEAQHEGQGAAAALATKAALGTKLDVDGTL
jgi:hypothetical protein